MESSLFSQFHLIYFYHINWVPKHLENLPEDNKNGITCLVIALNYYSDDNKQNPLTWFYLLFLHSGSSIIPLKRKAKTIKI